VDTFAGTITLDDGEQVPVDLDFDEENLTLRTEGKLVGVWPVKYCRVARSGRGAVILSLDGEKVVFEPEDLPTFATAAAQRFRASTLADRIGVVLDLPAVDGPAGLGSDGETYSRATGFAGWLGRVAGLIVVAAGILVLGWVAIQWRGDAVDFAGTTITISSTIAAPPPLFEQTVEQFTTEWNLTATAFGVPVQIRGTLPPGRFESQLTPHLVMQGRTAGDGTIESIVLVIDPTGDREDDQVALSALGVAIAVANPALEREQRAEVLAVMGLSIGDPDLTALEGEVEVDGVSYTLSYVSTFESLLFAINDA
jgi:hypothetical protein